MDNSNSQAAESFRFRGESMTRIETFVAAAFAFAVSMLVISLGEIPDNIDEFILAIKNVPSFITSCALILWIWYCHADWSRRFGLEDATTIFLSGGLICIVLVLMYPLRLMMQGLFMQLSGGFFPFEMAISQFWELRLVFAFYAAGFTLLSLNFMALNQHAMNQAKQLELNTFELFYTQGALIHWRLTSAICGTTLLLTLVMPNSLLLYTPYCYMLLWPVHHVFSHQRKKQWENQHKVES